MSKKREGIHFPQVVMEAWLVENMGDPKVDGNKAEWRYNEVEVSDYKKKLYVNVEKSKYVGFKSGTGGPFEKLVSIVMGCSETKAIEHLLIKYLNKMDIADLSGVKNSINEQKRNRRSQVKKDKAWSNLPEKSYRISLDDRYSSPYVKYLKGRGVSNHFINGCYYSLAKNYNNMKLDFKEYVIIPYYDTYGKITYWTARAIKDIDPKYLNCPDSDADNHIYNIHTDADEVVITEGVFDALKFGKHGIAFGGKVFSDEQIDMVVNKQFNRLIIGGNNEEFDKGPRDSLKLFDALKKRKQNVFLFDWDSYCAEHNIFAKDFSEIRSKKLFSPKDIESWIIADRFEAEIRFKLNKLEKHERD